MTGDPTGGNDVTARLTPPPPTIDPSALNGDGRLRDELAALRLQLRILDDIDLQTNDMVDKLMATVRSLVELRAKTSLDIAGAIERIEALADAREAAQRRLLLDLRGDIARTQQTAGELAAATAALDRSYQALQERIAAELAPPRPPAPPEPTAAPPPATPRPDAETITLRFENVDSAATALSLQRFVSRVPGVTAVTGRQYVGTDLRLDAAIRGELFYDDLLDWPGGELTLLGATEDGARLAVTRVRAAGA